MKINQNRFRIKEKGTTLKQKKAKYKKKNVFQKMKSYNQIAI